MESVTVIDLDSACQGIWSRSVETIHGYVPDGRVFAEVRWADPAAVLAKPLEGLDPNMHRFFATMLRALALRTSG